MNGETVWRKTVDVPAEWEGKILQIGVARVKSFDSTYFDGKEVGSTGPAIKDSWNQPRRYRIPGALVKGGKALVAIREFAPDTQGGVHGLPEEMFLRAVATGKKAANLYHSDFKEDFELGGNPYRYYRW